LTENRNYGIVIHRWMKGASHAPTESGRFRLEWRNRRDKAHRQAL
jgi:hypothetical protein